MRIRRSTPPPDSGGKSSSDGLCPAPRARTKIRGDTPVSPPPVPDYNEGQQSRCPSRGNEAPGGNNERAIHEGNRRDLGRDLRRTAARRGRGDLERGGRALHPLHPDSGAGRAPRHARHVANPCKRTNPTPGQLRRRAGLVPLGHPIRREGGHLHHPIKRNAPLAGGVSLAWWPGSDEQPKQGGALRCHPPRL